MKQIASIVGITASGKTALALDLASELLANPAVKKVRLVSADSRQVYQGLENLTGADIPDGFEKKMGQDFPYWQKGAISLYGVAIVPTEFEWSLGHFRHLLAGLLSEADRQTVTLVVGGTGLYHRFALHADPALEISPNAQVRAQASTMSVEQLQGWVEDLSSGQLIKMNDSDRQNPRRLVRLIEQLKANTPPNSAGKTSEALVIQPALGLQLPEELLVQRITARVQQRLIAALAEVERVQKQSPGQLVTTTLGWSELSQLLAGEMDQTAAEASWVQHELAYAKRQVLWWKRETHVHWQTVRNELDLRTARDWLSCAILGE